MHLGEAEAWSQPMILPLLTWIRSPTQGINLKQGSGGVAVESLISTSSCSSFASKDSKYDCKYSTTEAYSPC